MVSILCTNYIYQQEVLFIDFKKSKLVVIFRKRKKENAQQ